MNREDHGQPDKPARAFGLVPAPQYTIRPSRKPAELARGNLDRPPLAGVMYQTADGTLRVGENPRVQATGPAEPASRGRP